MPVRYQILGEGRPLVLVHGLGGSTDWWVRNVEAFSHHYKVYLVDLPGFGSMRKYGKTFSVTDAARWLADLLDALQLRAVSMIGHSMGGLITAMFAARWPNRVTRLVLAAPAIALSRNTVTAFLLPMAQESLYVPISLRSIIMRDAIRAGFFTLLRAGRELLTVDVADELSLIASPTLLVWGQRDVIVPVKLSGSLQLKIRNSELHVIPRAGHVVMYDRAADFNKVVLKFLAADS